MSGYSMHDTPVVLPGAFYEVPEGVTVQDWTKKLRDGQEDPGDTLSRQVGGNHYKVASIQPWDVIAAYGLDPWSANVLKYLLRFPYKAGRQDLEKAQHYIEYLITHYDDVNNTYYNQ